MREESRSGRGMGGKGVGDDAYLKRDPRTKQRKITMFQLNTGLSAYKLRGFIAENSKVYFSTVDIGLILGEEDLLDYAYHLASCKANEITKVFGHLAPSAWMVTYNSLIDKLSLALPSDPEFVTLEVRLLGLLKYGYVSVTQVEKNIVHLVEDSLNGKLFMEWVAQEKIRLRTFPPSYLEP